MYVLSHHLDGAQWDVVGLAVSGSTLTAGPIDV